MLSMPSHPRHPRGLPNSPRPKNPSVHNSPYNAAGDILQTSTVRSRPEYPVAGPPSLHARSRSQPPRPSPSPSHSRSTSSSIQPDYASANSEPRKREWPRSRTNQEDRQRSAFPAGRNSSPPPSLPGATPDTRSNNYSAEVREPSGDNYAIWNAVTNAASGLTISVTKAWTAKITTFSGEETPPGQETRLTRAMKAYHIAKAQKPSDLPEWLFDERERQVVGVQAQPDDVLDDRTQATKLPQNDQTSGANSNERTVATSARFNPVSSQPRLRGADRLKAMRDAKRGEATEQNLLENFTSRRNLNTDSPAIPQSVTHQSRVGLPSGPQRGRRQ